jgi:hypothetical protein
MRRLAILLMAVAAMGVAGSVSAHEGHDHGKKVMGTVKAVHPEMNHVQITTKDGKTAEFYVDAKTKYYRGSTSVSLSDLAPGTRVTVDTKADGQRTLATVVRIGAAAKTKTATKSSAHKH